MIEEIKAISNEPYYNDCSTIQEICASIKKIPMRHLLKNSGYLNYNLGWYANSLCVPLSKVYRMNFFEFAYHLFDKRMDTYWNKYSEWENKILCVQILHNLLQIFISNDLTFMQLGKIDLASYLNYFDPSEKLMNDLADTIASSSIQIGFNAHTGEIGIFECMTTVNKHFYNCARMYEAKEAYEIFKYIWKYSYEISHNMKKGA